MSKAWFVVPVAVVLATVSVLFMGVGTVSWLKNEASSAVNPSPDGRPSPLANPVPSSTKNLANTADPLRPPAPTTGATPVAESRRPRSYREYEREMRQLMRQIGPNVAGLFETLKLTMQSAPDLQMLRKLCERIVDEGLSGDVYETGCWRGGTGIWMALVFNKYERFKGINSTRHFYLFDSFEGFSEAPGDGKLTQYLSKPVYTAPIDEVKQSFRRFGVLNERTHFVKGFFEETMPAFSVPRPIAVLRLDGDLYSSTKVVLEHLYSKLERRGWCIADDYTWNPIPQARAKSTKLCSEAVDEFRDAHGITARIEPRVCGRPCWQNNF